MHVSPRIARVVLIVFVVIAAGLAINHIMMSNQNHSVGFLPQPVKPTSSKLDSVYITFSKETAKGTTNPVEIRGQKLSLKIGQVGMFLCQMRDKPGEDFIDAQVVLRCDHKSALVKVPNVAGIDGAIAVQATQPGECELSITIVWQSQLRTFKIPLLVSKTSTPAERSYPDTRA